MTARGVASRLVAVHGVGLPGQKVWHRRRRASDAAFAAISGTYSYTRACVRLTFWRAVSTAILRREGVGHA